MFETRRADILKSPVSTFFVLHDNDNDNNVARATANCQLSLPLVA